MPRESLIWSKLKKKEYEGNEAASRENNPPNIPGRSLQWQNYVTLRGDWLVIIIIWYVNLYFL